MTIQTKTIPLQPFGKARPRVTRNGTFMPPDYERKRSQLKMMFGAIEVDGLVIMRVTAWRRIPKSAKHDEGDYCTAGPDSDNIAGAVMDSLFPDDDSRVVSIFCEKLWGNSDCLQIQLIEANWPRIADEVIESRRDLWTAMADE